MRIVTRWVAFISVGVGVSASHFVCFGAKPTQKACMQDLPRDWKRMSQSREDAREETRTENRPFGRREQELGLVDSEAGLANVRGWVSVPGGFVGISLEYTLALAHRCTESYAKVSQTSHFLRLELTQAHVCLFSLLPPSRLCMLCFVCP